MSEDTKSTSRGKVSRAARRRMAKLQGQISISPVTAGICYQVLDAFQVRGPEAKLQLARAQLELQGVLRAAGLLPAPEVSQPEVMSVPVPESEAGPEPESEIGPETESELEPEVESEELVPEAEVRPEGE